MTPDDASGARTGTDRRARRDAYAFGDVGAAASRLGLLDEVFAGPSRALLEVAPNHVELAVDLGCGPGFSTRLVSEVVRPARLAGLDTSEAFLDQARANGPRTAWHRHDVTAVPFPTGPADLLHARFVLSHLPHPEHVLMAWLGQLRPRGTLLVQEDDRIAASDPALVGYEELARSLVAHRGGDLWVGARLAALVPPPGYRVVTNHLLPYRVSVPLTARLFAMNFAVWRHDPFVAETNSPTELEGLAHDLGRLAESDTPGDVIFHLRQLAYRREDGEDATDPLTPCGGVRDSSPRGRPR